MNFEKTYGSARSYLSILAVFAWSAVILGSISFLVGFSTGGLLSQITGDITLTARLVSSLPGLFTTFSGLIGVALTHIGRALLDSADMTREMLTIARTDSELLTVGQVRPKLVPTSKSTAIRARQLSNKEVEKRLETINSPSKPQGKLIETFKGFRIYKADDGYYVKSFSNPTVEAARADITKSFTDSGHRLNNLHRLDD